MTATLLRAFAGLSVLSALFGAVVLGDAGSTGAALSFGLGATLGGLLLFALAAIVEDVRRIAERGGGGERSAERVAPRSVQAEAGRASDIAEVGRAADRSCPGCGAMNPASARFCHKCGKTIS